MTKLLCDREIKCYCCDGYVEDIMLDPFVDHQVSDGVISYGLSSFGYDIRLSDTYLVFSPSIVYHELQLVDPKNFNAKEWEGFLGRKLLGGIFDD